MERWAVLSTITIFVALSNQTERH